jgi:hypothetical protein
MLILKQNIVDLIGEFAGKTLRQVGIITLADRMTVRCSPEDHAELNKYSWYKNGEYAHNPKIGLMHRYIIEKGIKQVIPKHHVVDHINRNGLDNTRENLRIVTRKQNACNRSKKKNTSSKYKGASYNKKRDEWKSFITIDGKLKHLGTFDNEMEAAEMYDRYLAYRKQEDPNEIRELNFPEDYENYLKEALILPKCRKSITGFKGVYGNFSSYQSQIRVNNKLILLLKSKSKKKCAKAYDKYIVEHKLNKPLNFSENYPNYVPDRKIKTTMKEINEKTIQLIIKKHPELTILIDKEDYDKVKYLTCSISNNRVIICVNKKSRALSRYLMNETDSDILIDHKDRNPLNNCKLNLRKSNVNLNSHNRKKHERKTSKYNRVYKKNMSNWRAIIQIKGKEEFSKLYEIEEHAARAVDLHIIKNLPDQHYNLNFDDWNEEIIKKWTKILNF